MSIKYILAQKLYKIAGALRGKERITVGDINNLVEDKKRFLIYSNNRYRVIDEDDFEKDVKRIWTLDGFILIN